MTQSNSLSPRLRALARRIDQHAQISTRPGQLEDLESIATELRDLAGEVKRLHADATRATN